MRSITNEQIIEASKNTNSATEAADLLGINYKTYKKYSKQLGCFKTNQSGKGTSKNRARKYNVNDNVFSELNKEVAYWLGFIAADGSVVENSLSFTLAARDRDIIEKFKEFADSEAPINNHKSHYKAKDGTIKYFDAINFKITSKQIVKDLNKFGIVQGKKYMDINFLKNIPNELKLSFLIGLFDGDGSISLYNNDIKTCVITIASNFSTNKEIENILNSIEIVYSTRESNTIKVVYINKLNAVLKFIEVYKDQNNINKTLDRKLNKIKEYEKYILDKKEGKIKTIKHVSEKTESCKNCGKPITKQSTTGLCLSCANVQAKGKSPKPSKDELESLLKQGIQKKQIAEMYDRNPSTIQYWVESYGLSEYKHTIKEHKQIDKSGVTCVELNIHFKSFKEAAEYIVQHGLTSATNIGSLGYKISQSKKYRYKVYNLTWI